MAHAGLPLDFFDDFLEALSIYDKESAVNFLGAAFTGAGSSNSICIGSGSGRAAASSVSSLSTFNYLIFFL